MKNIVIAGGTGLIGSRLAERLSREYHVYVLTRTARPPKNGVNFVAWNPENSTIDLPDVCPDVIVNLAGEGIADQRWTHQRKNQLIQSRVTPALCLSTWLNSRGFNPALYIGASAIGYYGDRGNELLDESSRPGKGFMPECAELWESAHTSVPAQRQLTLRIGIVLSSRGGALPKMLQTVPFLRLLPYFGDGSQMQSWIHIDDLCAIVEKAIHDNAYQGVFNAVAPSALSNKHMVKQISKALPFFTWMAPVPAFILKLMLGEMSHVVLDSTRVVPASLMQRGFTFVYPEISGAVADIRSRHV